MFDSYEVGGLGNVFVDKGFGGNVNEVGVEDFVDEGERMRGMEVVFDDFEGGYIFFGIFSVNDLYVEGIGDVLGFGDFLCNFFDMVYGVLV